MHIQIKTGLDESLAARGGNGIADSPAADLYDPLHAGSHVALRYASVWDDNLKRRLDHLVSHLSTMRACDICQVPFSLERDVFTYSSAEGGVDLLYPNLYANICFGCFDKAFRGYKGGSRATHAKRLYDLFQLIGKAPTTKFDSLTYQLHNRETIVKYISLLQAMPSQEDYIKEFGSLFGALKAAGIFPKRRTRKTIGTMMVATDGHCCLSSAEREIDDFLSAQGIEHNKEVAYPGSGHRADWELFGSARRTFVEYFGVTKNGAYADKAKLKTAFAFAHGIELLPIYKNTDWKSVILTWKSHGLNDG